MQVRARARHHLPPAKATAKDDTITVPDQTGDIKMSEETTETTRKTGGEHIAGKTKETDGTTVSTNIPTNLEGEKDPEKEKDLEREKDPEGEKDGEREDRVDPQIESTGLTQTGRKTPKET